MACWGTVPAVSDRLGRRLEGCGRGANRSGWNRVLERILYVEDDPDIQAVAQLALEAVGGYRVHLCSSGHQALQEAAAFQPQLLLLDVMMPGLDGPATLQALRRQPALQSVPAVFMTAKAQAHETDYFLSLGAAAVITKPFDPMTLAQEVRGIWETARDRAGGK